MKTFNWGIIGPGKIAHKFAQDIQLVEGAKIHAVASRSKARAADFAKKYNADFIYDKYSEIVNCPDLDAIYIATPHSGHFENTLHCLQNKIPVLCEKPLAMNLTQVKKMIGVAKENNTFLMEALWTRFLPLIKETLKIVKADEIGAINLIKADFGFKASIDLKGRLYNPDLGGGALLDIGIYPVFFALLFLGKPDDIKAVAKIGKTGIDETTAILFKYKTGKTAVLDCTILANTPCEGFIYGEKGAIKIHRRFHESKEVSLQFSEKPEQKVHLPKTGNGYYHEAIEVMDCIRAGKKESDLMPLSFSLDLIKTLDNIRKEINLVYPKFDV